MKSPGTRQLAVAAVLSLLLSVTLNYNRSADADGQQQPARPMPATSIDINGDVTQSAPDQPVSRSYTSPDGSTQIDVSVEGHSSGNSRQQTDITIRTDGSSNTERIDTEAH